MVCEPMFVFQIRALFIWRCFKKVHLIQCHLVDILRDNSVDLCGAIQLQ